MATLPRRCSVWADIALYLDERDAITWGWRIAARLDWGLQGRMKHKVYPDFLVHLDAAKGTVRLLVLETKGQHLAGNKDTEFKRRFFDLLEEAYRTCKDAGEVELFADRPAAMRFRILLDDGAWKPTLETAMA